MKQQNYKAVQLAQIQLIPLCFSVLYILRPMLHASPCSQKYIKSLKKVK